MITNFFPNSSYPELAYIYTSTWEWLRCRQLVPSLKYIARKISE